MSLCCECVCCQTVVCATSWWLVQKSPTYCGASLCSSAETGGSNPTGGMDVSLVRVCVLSHSGLCDELIARSEESYALWCVVVCDLETSWMRRPWPTEENCRANINKRLNYGGSFRISVSLVSCDDGRNHKLVSTLQFNLAPPSSGYYSSSL
jgi:hypothetical protein